MTFDYKTQYFRYRHYFLKLHNNAQQPVAKMSLALIFTLATISFFAIFALKPTFATIAKLSKKLNDSKKANQALEEKIKSLKQAEINYNKIENNIALINNALPNKSNFNSFASKINFLTYNNNVALISASFSGFDLLPSSTSKTKLEFKLSIAGDYANIKNFLAALEKLDRIIKIKTVNLSSKTTVKQAKLEAQISGEIYWLYPLKNKGVVNEKNTEKK